MKAKVLLVLGLLSVLGALVHSSLTHIMLSRRLKNAALELARENDRVRTTEELLRASGWSNVCWYAVAEKDGVHALATVSNGSCAVQLFHSFHVEVSTNLPRHRLGSSL